MSETERTLGMLKKRRGIVRGQITKLTSKVKDLESNLAEPNALTFAQQFPTKLDSLDKEFKAHHYNVIDLISEEDEDNLVKEQEVLDTHDEEVSRLTVRIQAVITSCACSVESGPKKNLSRRLTQLKTKLKSMDSAISALTSDVEIPLLEQYQERLEDVKTELKDIRHNLLSLELPEVDSLEAIVASIEDTLFGCGLKIKKWLHSTASTGTGSPSASSESKGVNLPKLDMPTFDGGILHWQTFWEQFRIAVHDRSDISEAEKLVYLRSSLKDGSARHVIEGLSQSGDQYDEAVKCLKSQFDRPRLIHQTHVKRILDIPQLKEGSGKELRKLHNIAQQHLRALKTMECEPSGPFITSLLELKLDHDTMFEWQRYSQKSTIVPDYNVFLEFIDLRAQASESMPLESKPKFPFRKSNPPQKPIVSFTASTSSEDANCVICKIKKHPLYSCSQFKALSHDKMLSIVKNNGLCMNCLRPGHFTKQCPSMNRCRKCQRPHHTLLHVEASATPTSQSTDKTIPSGHAVAGITSNTLLMTCQVRVISPSGSFIKARALLDSGSSASFMSERLAQGLNLSRSKCNLKISGVAGLAERSISRSVATFEIAHLNCPKKKLQVSAIVVPRVTCDLPLQPVHQGTNWSHISGLELADPSYGTPGTIDILLGIDVYSNVLLNGRRVGPQGTPTAFETQFGWVLAGKMSSTEATHLNIATNHISVSCDDDVLRKFWEIEENPRNDVSLSHEERTVVKHFQENHTRSDTGRFIVPLPKKSECKPLGESRSQAVRRFLSLERALHSRGQFTEFAAVMDEYIEMDHAELVPAADLQLPPKEVFYLPMHAVRKDDSTTTKLRVVFDASAKSASGISLNDLLLIGPTIHSSLIDVLIRFRFHRVALTADVSKMYRAVELFPVDRDLHRFVWRTDPNQPLKDYRMTRVTFGVSASSFAANMALKQNAIDHATKYPLAAETVEKSFYVDDCLTGADSQGEAILLQKQLQDLFSRGKFLLRKWNSSDPKVLQHLAPELKVAQPTQSMPESDHYTKTLGIEWNAQTDHFRLTISKFPPNTNVTKRVLVSDVAKTFDVLGWFSPSTIKVKILLQQLWELKIGWDDQVPAEILSAWAQWRSELPLLTSKHIPRCYFHKDSMITQIQLHGFSDASERAYGAVVYLRMSDSNGDVQISLVTSKTKVAPIKRLTIPRLELCGAYLLAQLLHHVQQLFEIPLSSVYAWTDSTIVLSWLVGNPRRFKTYVGNRVSYIVDLIGPDRWGHVNGTENPADCASRGLYPSELLQHDLWWNGPPWLTLAPENWPKSIPTLTTNSIEEEREVTINHAISTFTAVTPVIAFDRYSSFIYLKRVTGWLKRFIKNCQKPKEQRQLNSTLSTAELHEAEQYWVSIIQLQHFPEEIKALKDHTSIHRKSSLLSLNPILDSANLIRVGGRQQKSKLCYSKQHPLILHGKHPLTKLVIQSEHIRLLHAGPTLLHSSLSRRYHIVGSRNAIRFITRGCITCKKLTVRPNAQLIGQLPIERVTPDTVFNKVGVDYAGPVYVKYGSIRKPIVAKAYVCVFVSLLVKAVHLELVSDLTSLAFISALRRFTSRRGKPTLIWSDNGTNFTGASRELKEFFHFLKQQISQREISEFCSSQGITWKFIPEHTPHFGGLWEAAVKSMKTHLRRIISSVKLTFEEMCTVLTQIESCLNSRPLVPLPNDDDSVEVLTPGHFLIGRPLEAIPDPAFSYRDLNLLNRWHLCQALVRHFWKRWSNEYLTTLRRCTKWHFPSRNLQLGDIVILQEDNLVPLRWPMGKVIRIHPGKDKIVRVVTIKTASGVYKRPITKVALLIPAQTQSTHDFN